VSTTASPNDPPNQEHHLIGLSSFARVRVWGAALACCLSLYPTALLTAQAPAEIVRVRLASGRSYPVQTISPVTKVTVANPDVADVVVVGERDVVINGRARGETDVILFSAGAVPRQLRVSVQTPVDRPQISLAVKLAEVRRDRLTQFGVSQYYLGKNATVGTEVFRNPLNQFPRSVIDSITVQTGQLFTNVLGFNNSELFRVFLEAERRRGDARLLAEPTLLTANGDTATFLSGGELPIPVAQGAQGGGTVVTIVYREFGVRLNFVPEVLSDSLIRLRVRPEVSSLDFANAITLQGFRVPALRTRRVETTVDVRRGQTLIISGLFNEERERVKTGIPILMDIPILGNLFSSQRWQRAETELIAVVTPEIYDPMRIPNGVAPGNSRPLLPDTVLPARGAIQKRLPAPPAPAPAAPAARP
jgi:pilus assembly protein CpaC